MVVKPAAWERVHPAEGEVVAARRLVGRVLQTYGRLVDVITADALYLEAPFLEQVLAAGKHVVVVLKQEARELYQDAERLRALVAPRVIEAPPRTTRLWDLPELRSFPTLGRARARDPTLRLTRGPSALEPAPPPPPRPPSLPCWRITLAGGAGAAPPPGRPRPANAGPAKTPSQGGRRPKMRNRWRTGRRLDRRPALG